MDTDGTFDVFAALASAASALAGDTAETDTSTDCDTDTDSTTTSTTDPSKRFIHNVCERKRRENIREAFSQLQRRVVPSGDRVSKVGVLERAMERVRRVKREVALLEAEAKRRGLTP